MTFPTLRAATVAIALAATPAVAQDSLLNTSYDIARELFEALNPEFAAHWQETTGRTVTVDQSHGGSSRQARAILEGLAADVVTFNQETDIDVLAQGGLLPEDWRDALPNGASPWYSLPAFLVREGNPQNIQDWDDLARDDVQVIFPNPRTSGSARYSYLAAFAYGLEQNNGDEDAAEAFVKSIFDNVPVFDTGGRGATQTFAERNIGDVLVTFEAETGGIAAAYADQGLERVTPSVSLFAAFPVAVVSGVTERNGNTELATAYLEWLYTPEAQRIVAQNYYRVANDDIAAEFADSLPEVRLVTVDEVFGGWDAIQENHFAEGARLDNVFVNQRRLDCRHSTHRADPPQTRPAGVHAEPWHDTAVSDTDRADPGSGPDPEGGRDGARAVLADRLQPARGGGIPDHPDGGVHRHPLQRGLRLADGMGSGAV